MSFDVRAKTGATFSRSAWDWRPLADYILTVAPVVAGPREAWGYNDGKGCGATEAAQLAAILMAEIEAGRTAEGLRATGSGRLDSCPRGVALMIDAAHAYIRSIRNPAKREYAAKYMDWCLYRALPNTAPPHVGDWNGHLSAMAAQAVRLRLAEFGVTADARVYAP